MVLNSAFYLWTGRIVVQTYSTPAVRLYPDFVTGNFSITTSLSVIGANSFLKIKCISLVFFNSACVAFLGGLKFSLTFPEGFCLQLYYSA